MEITGSSYPTAKRPRRPAGFGENRAQAASETTPAEADCLVCLRDVRYAVRVLMKAKASTAAAILILALGIGGNIAMFTFLDRLLYAPLPVPKPSQLQLVSCSGFARFPDGDRFKMVAATTRTCICATGTRRFPAWRPPWLRARPCLFAASGIFAPCL